LHQQEQLLLNCYSYNQPIYGYDFGKVNYNIVQVVVEKIKTSQTLAVQMHTQKDQHSEAVADFELNDGTCL
jgi:hypothetical protein